MTQIFLKPSLPLSRIKRGFQVAYFMKAFVMVTFCFRLLAWKEKLRPGSMARFDKTSTRIRPVFEIKHTVKKSSFRGGKTHTEPPIILQSTTSYFLF